MTTQQAEPSTQATHDDRLWRVLALVLAGSAAFLLLSLVRDLRGAWSIWKQGDWLINSINGPVRRGPSGSLILHVADALGVSPVTVVVGLQVVLVGVLYGAYYLAVRGLADPRLALLLTCSPAMFLMIWPANVLNGALRKELIAMAALALMLLYLRRRQLWTVVLAGVLMAAGAWSHELVILFVPAYVYLAWRAVRTDRRVLPTRVIVGVVAVVGVSSLFAGLYVLGNSGTTNLAAVCEPLTSRGLDPRICSGPLRWLGMNTADSMELVRRRNVTPGGLASFGLGFLVSVAPLAYVVVLMQRRRVAALAALAAVPMLPLFVVVIDWGRWLSCGVFVFVAVLLAHALTDDLPLRRRPALAAPIALLVVCCVVVPYHVNGFVLGGVFAHAYELASGIWN